MAKVEVVEKSADVVVTDSHDRKITLKRPNVLAQYRLVDALSDSAENRVYLGMCVPLLYVAEIDGAPIAQPTSKLQIEALIQRLDEHGLAAITAGIEEHFSARQGVDAAKK